MAMFSSIYLTKGTKAQLHKHLFHGHMKDMAKLALRLSFPCVSTYL